ncbi:MAG: enoyl-CoA hydratase/isomerase family protein [Rhodospirillaceae bacterium]
MTGTEPDILFSVRGSLGLVTLNRPQALNALTLEMFRTLDVTLAAWERDPAVRAVVVRGNGRAFCAGGDVVHVHESGLAAFNGIGDRGALAREVFAAEYRVDRRIARFPKPYIALLDGLVMGGGAGISLHGSHPLVTENTKFAMPECGIGLFPDIGASYFLPRCPGRTGLWLGLTGARIQAADLLYLGLARALIPGSALDALVDDLVTTAPNRLTREGIDSVIARYAVPALPAPLAQNRDMIDRYYAFDQVEAIMAALEQDRGALATEQLAALRRASPTALKLTMSLFTLGAQLSLEDCLRQEYRLSQACLAGHDFYEGVRAMLIDKDKAPRWRPATPAEVDEALIERHFVFRPDIELSFPGEPSA